MTAVASRALAAAGFAVMQVDLLGCGDSSGDFGDADWSAWLDDLSQARDWLRARFDVPLWLWGVRAGSLLASELAARSQAPCRFVFWQPQVNGKLVLQQFLRMKMASQLQAGSTKGVTEALLGSLERGEPVNVAGYTVSPGLAKGLAATSLLQPPEGVPVSDLIWLEVASRASPQILPASRTAIANWQNAGCKVQELAVEGQQFWQTADIEEAPALVDAMLATLDRAMGLRA